jgi:ribonuclease G
VTDAIAVDATPRLRRTALLAGNRVVEVVHERPGGAVRVGDVWVGRLARAAPALGGAFVDLGPAGEAFLKTRSGPPPEGAWLAVEVTVEAARDKRTRLKRASDQSVEGPPRRLVEAPPAPVAALRAEAAVARLVVEGHGLAAPARAWLAAAGRADVTVEVRGSPLFEDLGIDAALDEALAPRIPLPGGGALGIEEGRALAAIDVDAARGARAANLAAAEVIPWLLRLRDIGGLVVVDFIGMRHAADRQAVMARLRAGLSADPRVGACNGLSPLGLAEIARKRLGPSLLERTTSAEGVADRIAQRLLREAAVNPSGRFAVACASDVAAALGDVGELEAACGRAIVVQVRDGWRRDRFEVGGLARG